MDGQMGHVITSKSLELMNIGSKAYSEGKLGVAYLHYMASLVADPENHLSWMNLGAVLSNMQKSPASEAAARRALSLDPNDPGKMNNLANALSQQRKYSEAIEIYHKVLTQVPEDAGVHHNLGLCYYVIEQFDRAEIEFEQAVALRPGVTVVKNDLAMTRLALGVLHQGLAEYEVRWDTLHKSKVWSIGVPEWQGQSLYGRSILVHHEQGFGDSLMLCRFIPELLAKGAKVSIAVPKELIRLFRSNFPGCLVLDWDDNPENAFFDFHTPMLSMMRHLDYAFTADIEPSVYLKAPGTFDIDLKGKFKVGLCWASGDHGFALQKRRRVIGLDKFLPLAADPRVQIVSLQKGQPVKEIEYCGAQALVYDALARAEDFADTADVISKLDLVISVDSAVAHLAAAMGKPVIMLSPSPRCWRWWNELNGEPWYSDMAIVQQAQDGTWDEALAEMLDIFRGHLS